MPIALWPERTSTTRSIIRNGSRCGIICMIRVRSISAAVTGCVSILVIPRLGQTAERGGHAMKIAHRKRRRTEHSRACRDVAHDAGLGADPCTRADIEMSDEARLTADHHEIAQLGAA